MSFTIYIRIKHLIFPSFSITFNIRSPSSKRAHIIAKSLRSETVKEITNARAQTQKKTHHTTEHKKNRRRKENCFLTLIINMGKYLNKALTLLIHPTPHTTNCF